MAGNHDQDTRKRILTSAAGLFAERGIHATTVKDICEHADANVAAVNYYFGSKDKLIEEVWQDAFAAMQREHGTETTGLPAAERLACLVRAHLQAVRDDGPGGVFTKIVFRALSEFDQEQVEDLFRRHLEPRMTTLLDTVRDILGPDASDTVVRACALGIHSPCVHLNIARHRNRGPIFQDSRQEPDTDVIIQTLTDFILGGVSALRSQYAGMDR